MNAMNETEKVIEDNPYLNAAVDALKLNAGTLVHRITAFCIKHENGRVFAGWKPETIRLMVAYHAAKGTLLYQLDAVGEVVAVGMWYRCNWSDGWEFVKNWTMDRVEGDTIHMAFLFAENRAAFKRLTLSFIWKEPDALTKRLSASRWRSGQRGCKIEYSTKLFNRILRLKD